MSGRKTAVPAFLSRAGRGGAAAFLCLTLLGPGCGGQDFMVSAPDPYVPNTSEASVIQNLLTAYARRDIEAYAGLLADDFSFCFDDETKIERPELPLCLSCEEDVACTAAFFDDVASILIRVGHYGPAAPANEPGREGQTIVDVSDMFVEVKEKGDVDQVTLRVDPGQIRMYFRKGRNPAGDPPDDRVYLVNWMEFGSSSRPVTPADPDPPRTWSGLKGRYCR